MQEYRIFSLYSKDIKTDRNTHIKNAEEFIAKHSLPQPEKPMYIFKVLSESQDYRKLKSLEAKAADFNLRLAERGYDIKYDKNDMVNAFFFELKLGIFGTEDHSDSYHTKSDDFYCKSCDTHQSFAKKDVYINKADFRGRDIAVTTKYNNEIIVSDKMKNLIEQAGLSGAEFYPAYHCNNRLKADYPLWHMAVTSEMPPIDKAMPVYIIDGYCNDCKKHHILPLSYVRYTSEELEKAMDLNLSCECFGPGWYGAPKLIISRKAYELIKQNNIRGCKFEIVGKTD